MEKVNIYGDSQEPHNKILNYIKQGYSIKDIALFNNVPAYKIVSILLAYEKDTEAEKEFIINRVISHYNTYNIDQNRCVIISDNHMGRNGHYYENLKADENERLLYSAYEFAESHGIHYIINGGDVIEGLSNPNYLEKMELKDQLEYIRTTYPKAYNIKTYLLYGNHEYNELTHGNAKIEEILLALYNVEIIGLYYSYVRFNNELLKISHSVDAPRLNNISLPYQIEFAGHSHQYAFYEDFRKVSIPTTAYEERALSCMGFLELIDEGQEYIIKRYDNAAKYKAEDRLSKKNK